MVLTCIFLLISNIEHLFIYLLTFVCVFREISIQFFCWFLKWAICYFSYWVVRGPYTVCILNPYFPMAKSLNLFLVLSRLSTLSTMSFKFIHIVANGSISFFSHGWVTFYCLPIFSPVLFIAFSFCWLFYLLYRSFLIRCSPTCLCFVACAFGVISNHCQGQRSEKFLCLFF